MSLVCQALVLLTHYVLDGATWAGDRVWEQPVDPISELLRHEDSPQQPVISVYIESLNMQVSGRQTQGTKGEAELKIFVYVAPGKTMVPEGTAFALDGSTAGLTLNLMGRQIDAAFHGEVTGWLQVWNKFIVKITSREVRYILVEIEKAVKIPAMEICYRCETIPDPDFGVPMSLAWQMFDTELRAASGEKAMLADVFKEMIENPAGLPSFDSLQRNFGLTVAGLAATGLAPFNASVVDEVTGEAPVLESATPVGDAVVSPAEDINL